MSNFDECVAYAKSNDMPIINYRQEDKTCNPVNCVGHGQPANMAQYVGFDTYYEFEVYSCKVSQMVSILVIDKKLSQMGSKVKVNVTKVKKCKNSSFQLSIRKGGPRLSS